MPHPQTRRSLDARLVRAGYRGLVPLVIGMLRLAACRDLHAQDATSPARRLRLPADPGVHRKRGQEVGRYPTQRAIAAAAAAAVVGRTELHEHIHRADTDAEPDNGHTGRGFAAAVGGWLCPFQLHHGSGYGQ